MPVPVDSSDANLWTAFVAGIIAIFGTIGAGLAYALGQVSKVRDAVNQQGIDDLASALDAEKRFATKADIRTDMDRLEMRITESFRAMLREHENNVQRDIENRIALRGRQS